MKKKDFVLTGAIGGAGITAFAFGKPVIAGAFAAVVPAIGTAAMTIAAPAAAGAVLGLAAYGLLTKEKKEEKLESTNV
jgi:hypothetical protein